MNHSAIVSPGCCRAIIHNAGLLSATFPKVKTSMGLFCLVNPGTESLTPLEAWHLAIKSECLSDG